MNGTTYCNECFKKKMKENNGVIENGDCSITFEGNIEIDQKEKE